MALKLTTLLLTISTAFCISSFGYATDTLVISLEAPSLSTSNNSTNTIKTASEDKKAIKQDCAQKDTVTIGHVGVVDVSVAYIYKTKSAESSKIITLKSGTPLAVVKEETDWYGVLMTDSSIGWVPQKNVKMLGYDLVAPKQELNRGSSISRGGKPDRADLLNNEIMQIASQYDGVRYVYGGTDPDTGIDCSAFVRSVFKQRGINLPRTAREQAQVGESISFDQLQSGDRLYFACKHSYVDHCGIYIGGGYFVHCSASRRGVGIDTLSSNFYSRSLVAARRS